jgi:short subunit dehydrogenase-like uncharacterized protein
MTSLAFAIGGLCMLLPPFRSLMKKLLPQGSGPSEKVMRSGHFTTKVIGVTEDNTKAIATVTGVHDPGYLETAKMVSESAITLALDRKTKLDVNKGVGTFGVLRGGILTPSTAMGLALVDRLREAGMGFKVEEVKA